MTPPLPPEPDLDRRDPSRAKHRICEARPSLLLLCSVAALTHHRRTLWRQERLLSLLLAICLV